MSRSYCRTSIRGTTTAASEKWDKQLANRRLRRVVDSSGWKRISGWPHPYLFIRFHPLLPHMRQVEIAVAQAKAAASRAIVELSRVKREREEID